MKILYTGMVNLHRGRGDAIHFTYLAYALQARGHQLAVVARGPRDFGRQRGIEFYPTPDIKLPKAGTLFNDLSTLAILARLLHTQKFDVLYHRSVPMANRLAHRATIPVITEVNGIQIDEFQAAGMRNLGIRLYRCREQQIVTNADTIVCVTEGIRDRLRDIYAVSEDQCTVIANATDTTMFSPQPQQICQEKVGLSTANYNVGFVGAFQPWIDFDHLFKATQTLRAQKVPIYLALVGDGPKFAHVKQQAQHYALEKHVHFVGRVPHSEIPDWIGAFDVCVAPSGEPYVQQIGKSSMKLYEYMACARPVVATALPGIAETIAASQCGFVYRVGDTNALQQHLHTLYKDDDLRMLMGKRGRDYVIKHHSWESVAGRTEKLMLHLLSDRKHSRH